LICLLILSLVGHLHARTSYEETESVTNGEQCKYVKYEGGDGSVFPISPMPTPEAAVPTTALADLFGKAPADWLSKVDKVADGWMAFGSAMTGTMSTVFSDVAPALGPLLGVIGVGFGFDPKTWNTVQPEQIIAEVNKAIKKVVEETNRRFELFREFVTDEIREYMKEAMEDDYRGQFETWKDCTEYDTFERVNDCQIDSALAAKRTKYKFMFQNKYEAENSGNEVTLTHDEIKAIELQLPILKKWADFHLLVLGGIVKTYEDKNKKLFDKYRGDLIEEGNYYVGYLEWGLERVRRARLDEQPSKPSLRCPYGYEKEWKFCFSCGRMMSSKYLQWTSQKCEFKSTSMKASYCDIKGTKHCGRHCFLGRGLFWRSADDSNLWSYQRSLHNDIQRRADTMVNEYNEKLSQDFNTFWKKEVKMYIPKFKEIIAEIEGDDSGKRDDAPEKPKLTAEQKKIEEKLDAELKEEDEETKKILNGITAEMSLTDYLKKIKENTSLWQKKQAKKNKKKSKSKSE